LPLLSLKTVRFSLLLKFLNTPEESKDS